MEKTAFCSSCQYVFSSDQTKIFGSFHDHRRRTMEKVSAFFRSFFNELKFLSSMIYPSFLHRSKKWFPLHHARYNEKTKQFAHLPWSGDQQSEGLIVFITGLFGNPIGWDRYIKELHKQGEKAHIFVPGIPYRGNSSLQEAADPILDAIEAYHKKFPDKKISLVGISNGARIAGYIERSHRMRSAAMQVHSIAGIHFGSPLSKVIPGWYLDLKRIKHALRREMNFKNPFAKKYLDEWVDSARITGALHQRHFYASTNDEKLPRVIHSLPRISPEDKHYIYHKATHKSILDVVQPHIIKEVRAFIHSNNA